MAGRSNAGDQREAGSVGTCDTRFVDREAGKVEQGRKGGEDKVESRDLNSAGRTVQKRKQCFD